MLPVVDKPLIQYAVEEARAAGIEQFIFVTGRSKTAIEDHFDLSYELETTMRERGKDAQIREVNSWMPEPGQIAFTRQQKPLGLGHAVLCARHLIGDEPFAVLLADDLILSDPPCLRQMTDVRAKIGGSVVGIIEVPREHTNRYGVLDVAKDDGKLVTLKGVVEKPEPAKAPSNLSIIGRYILEPEVFEYLAHLGKGAGGEIQLTDGLAELIKAGRPFHGLRFDGKRFDCGDKAGFFEANVAFALNRADMAPAVKKILDQYR
jgi:UTP--glucose-1-phosphate uridylyltransferase